MKMTVPYFAKLNLYMALILILTLKLTNTNSNPNDKLIQILTVFSSLGALLRSAYIWYVSNVTWVGRVCSSACHVLTYLRYYVIFSL